MTAYYNEKDPFAAEWLRKLIIANMIAPGDVDERSIEDVIPVELAKYVQCHFFAGIGVWSYAMRRAGWPDDRRGWSGSSPCQPFSQAGQGAGFADERHLWPAFFHLIDQCRPDAVFGEQVASPDGLAWLDLVQSDMEGTNYAFGALDQCAAGFGAPHIRQRLYWVAYNAEQGLERSTGSASNGERFVWSQLTERGAVGGVANNNAGLERRNERRDGADECAAWPFGVVSGVERPSSIGRERRQTPAPGDEHDGAASERSQNQHGSCIAGTPWIYEHSSGPVNGHWRAADWLRCKDDKWWPVEPGTFPLANGVANRMGLLRGYGNAIIAPQAEEFIKAAMQYAP